MRQIQLIHKDKIKPYANNPRNNTNAVAKVAESIKEFGFTNPLILDRDYNIIAGHTRFKAGQTLGVTEAYINNGTYKKSFSAHIVAPSVLSLDVIGRKNYRIHHKLNYNRMPQIISGNYKKL